MAGMSLAQHYATIWPTFSGEQAVAEQNDQTDQTRSNFNKNNETSSVLCSQLSVTTPHSYRASPHNSMLSVCGVHSSLNWRQK